MRSVVDVNLLSDPRLRTYLLKSESNHVVITDYCSMEIYKTNSLESIYRSFEIICEHPKQVIILKATSMVVGLSGRGSGLQKRLIDRAQTREFNLFAKSIDTSKKGNLRQKNALMQHGMIASEHMKRVLDDASLVAEAIREIGKIIPKEERANIRNGFPLSKEMHRKCTTMIMSISAFLFEKYPSVPWPEHNELPNTYIFRFSLCMCLLSLYRAAHGGVEGITIEKLRNDIVDMSYAAYATYFDGIMTKDKRLAELHSEARLWLLGMFDCNIQGGLHLPRANS